MSIYLKRISHYHPPQILTNQMLTDICGADPNWILERTGIQERRSMLDYEGDFPGLEIVSRCLSLWKERYPDALQEIDMIISASTHDDIHYPNLGNRIAARENLEVPVFQLKTACTSVGYAIYLARSILESSSHSNILILNGEPFTRYVDYGDKRSCILFGDASSIVVVSKHGGDFELMGADIGGHGLDIVTQERSSETSHLYLNEMITGELSHGKPWVNRRRKSDRKFQQDGRAVIDFVLTQMPNRIQRFVESHELSIQSFNHVILHQSNLILMKDLIERLGFRESQHIFNVDRFGNTSSAGWVTALSENQSALVPGSLTLVSIFGAGMTWANLILRKI